MTDRQAPPRLALTQQEAAAALGVSVETFTRHIRPPLEPASPDARTERAESGEPWRVVSLSRRDLGSQPWKVDGYGDAGREAHDDRSVRYRG